VQWRLRLLLSPPFSFAISGHFFCKGPLGDSLLPWVSVIEEWRYALASAQETGNQSRRVQVYNQQDFFFFPS